MSPRNPSWIAAVALAGIFIVTAAQRHSDGPIEASSTAEIYLLAEYSSGFPVTVPAPQLTAQPVHCEQNLCQPCIHQEALVVSNATMITEVATTSKGLPAVAKCVAPSGFTAGVYSLQAGAIAGSEEPYWACFVQGLDGIMSKLPAAAMKLDTHPASGATRVTNSHSTAGSSASGDASVSLTTIVKDDNTTMAAADWQAASVTSGTSYTPQATSLAASQPSAGYLVEFAPSNSYICIAHFTPVGTSAPAEGDSLLPALTGPTTTTPAATNSSTAKAGSTTHQDSAATELEALSSTSTGTAAEALSEANKTTAQVSAVNTTTAATAAVVVAHVDPTANATDLSNNTSIDSTADISFSTTDMTTDVTSTTTVTYDSSSGEILGWEAEVTASCSPPAYKQPPRGRPAAPLAVSGNRVINIRTRRPVLIHGINWFGFNVELAMLNGLWAGGTDAATDFSKIAYQLRQLGFNAVRLPFVHNFMAKPEVWDAVRDCTTMSDRDLKLRLIDPQDLSSRTKDKELPPNPSPMRNRVRGKCNTYLPSRSNMDRFLFVIQQFIAQGMYVVLDYQPQGLEHHPYNLAEFVGAWKKVWKKVTCLPNFNSDIAGRVLIDVMNEPDSMGIKWESNGQQPGAEQLYLATAEALWAMTPNKMLFMFEGTGQTSFGLNWGNGFITDRDIITSRGLSDPTPFFQRLVKRPFAKHTVISPHLYPPSITKSTWLGQDLWKQSNASFGYLQDKGFCDAGRCTRFPVIIGETGSAYVEELDKMWLKDFASFVMARGRARAYNTIPIAGWMWWAFNENSGDTGGIVMNNWQDIHWVKMRFMMDNLGLMPWYKHPSSRLTRRRRPRSSNRDTSSSRRSSTFSSSSSARRSSSRRQHRRNNRKQVTFDWAELGFDIGTLQPQAT